MLEIEVFQIPGGRKTVRVESDTAICGRSAKCAVVIRDPDVSRRHLRIELIGGELWAEDMGSSNGSTLDGEPLAQKSRFVEGQVLRICDHEIRVRIVAETEVSAEAAAGPMSHAAASQHTAATVQHDYAQHAAAHAQHAQAAHQQPAAQQPAPQQPAAQQPAPQQPAPQQPAPQQPAPQQPAPQQPAPQPLVAPAHGRVEVPADNPQSAHSFECKEALWQSYEQMAQEAGVAVDELVNEALAHYGRRRVYANAGSATQPQTSLQFVPRPPTVFDLSALPKR